MRSQLTAKNLTQKNYGYSNVLNTILGIAIPALTTKTLTYNSKQQQNIFFIHQNPEVLAVGIGKDNGSPLSENSR